MRPVNRIVVRPYMTTSSGVVFEPPTFGAADLDVHTPIHVATRYRVEPDEVRMACGLPGDCTLAVVLSVNCDLTLWASHATVRVDGRDAVEGSLDVEMPAGHAAGAVEAGCFVLLAEDLPRSDPFVASFEGSVLFAGPNAREILDGSGSHFPTDALSFDAAGRERGARWSVEYLYGTLEEPLLAGIRLLINTDTRAWTALNAASSDPLHQEVGTEMRRYVLSDMVRHAVEDEAFAGGVIWPEGSVGRHFDDVIRVYGRGRSIDQLRTMRRIDRSRFEEALQALEADVL
jgi:hypothetical protein